MSRAVPKNESGFELWLASAERTILLPSGTWMKIIVPSVRKLRRRNAFPTELLPMVKSFENEGVKLSELDDEELDEFIRMMNYLIAEMIRFILIPDEASSDIAPSGEWQPATLAGADLEEAELDEEDASALQAIAIRKLTANQVTIAARRDRALAQAKTLDEEGRRDLMRRVERERELERDAAAAIAEDDEETVAGWQNFRGDEGGDGARPNERAVRAAPERKPTPRRRGDRSSDR